MIGIIDANQAYIVRMKRKIILSVISIVCIVCAVFALGACNKKNKNVAKDNVSRQTDAFYCGESDAYAVSIEFGKRERTFIADGKATDVRAFCEISITPLKQNDAESLTFVVKGQDAELSGEVQTSNYGEFVAEIGLEFTPQSVVVTHGESASEIELCNVLEGALSANDVINIAKKEFADKISAEKDKPEREIYVKLISGDRTTYYYYVSFIGEGVDYWAMLVDIKTGEVVSKK